MPGPAIPASPGYYDPYANATVAGERTDQGLDTSAGKGSLAAIADGIITKILGPSNSGWPGSYIEYKITEPGPLQGQSVYYAEGVTAAQGLQVGQKVTLGQEIANVVPGWHTGIETGFASGTGSESYAMAHGGYVEGQSTAAGSLWAQIVAGLGGPKTTTPSTAPLVGQAPGLPGDPLTGATGLQLVTAGNQTTTPASSAVNAVGGAVNSAANAAESIANLAGDIGGFLSNPGKVLLTVALIAVGAMLVYTGVGRMFGIDHPVQQTAQKAAAAKVIAE
jgi:hypothetical protein